MPMHKDLKRRVRERRQETGESPTSARARVIEKRARSTTAAQPPRVDLARMAGMADAVVATKTGRSWAAWVTELDRAGAAARPHKEIALLLHEQHGVPGWWAQMVTVGYERIRGLRQKGQRRDGAFEVGKSRVYAARMAELWATFRRWLGGTDLRARKSTRHKMMQMLCSDSTAVEACFVPKGPAKTQLAIQHRKIASQAEATRLRAVWTERLTRIGEMLSR